MSYGQLDQSDYTLLKSLKILESSEDVQFHKRKECVVYSEKIPVFIS